MKQHPSQVFALVDYLELNFFITDSQYEALIFSSHSRSRLSAGGKPAEMPASTTSTLTVHAHQGLW